MQTSSLRNLRLLTPLAIAAACAGGCDVAEGTESFDASEYTQQRSLNGATGFLQIDDTCNENAQCESGRCDGPTGEQTCHWAIDNGGSCNENSDCVSGRCDGPAGQQICRAELGLGETCNENSDCASGRCDGDVGQMTCRAALSNGGDCNEDSDCISGRCDGALGEMECLSKVTLDEWCNEDSDCASNICDSTANVCHDVPPGTVAPHEACTYPEECESGRCTGEMCEQMHVGESCGDNSDCFSGYCTAEYAGEDEGICVKPSEVNSKKIAPEAWTKPLNLVDFAGCHNCYQPGNASGYTTYREVVRHIPALEIDVHLEYGNWFVGHDSPYDDDRFYRDLEDYFTEIQRTLANDEYQFPIIVNLDLKDAWIQGQGGHGESLDALIESSFGSYVFSKNDLAAYNGLGTGTSFDNPSWDQFRQKAASDADFWPSPIDDALRNKVIFVINHTSRGELDDVREFDNLFLGPALEYDSNVSGEIGNYVADGQTVFGNLAQDWGDCHGDLPQLLDEARIIGRCWDSNDSYTFSTQWNNGVAIGSDHDVEAQGLTFKIR